MHPPTPIPKLVPQKSSEPTSELSPGWPRTRTEFAALVEAYADRLVRYAFRQTGSLHDAEDIVQDVFSRSFDGSATRSVSAVGPYLYRAVGNACTDFLRRRNRAALFCEEVGVEDALAGAKGPPAVAQAAEELIRIERLLRQLPAEQAEAVRLRVFDELGLQEIAELTECSINTVCSRLRYAFAKLRSALSEREG
jgi:RNA polymerase sigma factor (sigma-70 family)